VAGLKRAIKTPSEEYENIGLEKDGKRLQINSNVLQIENELYAPIRPKRVTRSGETSDALLRGGIEYIEVASWISIRSHRLALMSSRCVSSICLWSGACWPMRRR
jgi:gamma-glutamylcysteine synthetase